MNFNVDYNEATGHELHRLLDGRQRLPLPARPPASRTAAATASTPTIRSRRPFGRGYGVDDYGPTCYTDIDPARHSRQPGSTPPPRTATRPRRADGLLKQGKTRIAEITDGTSNTIAIGEDAGRDARFVSPYTEGVLRRRRPPGPSSASGPAGGPTGQRRYWRWAEPDSAFGVSGAPNNKFRPMYEHDRLRRPPTGARPPGNNAGANDELFSFHPGGVNVLFGDGSVRFLKDTVNRHRPSAASSPSRAARSSRPTSIDRRPAASRDRHAIGHARSPASRSRRSGTPGRLRSARSTRSPPHFS